MTEKKVCVVGGGTGTYVTITSLRDMNVAISAIVTVADSGGSTGRLRDEFGFLPVGDIRQALAALASKRQQHWIKDMLLYRYEKGSGLEGHNLGNLILTALQDMTGSTAKAIETAAKIFRLKGDIYPVTTKNIQLVVNYQDGTTVVGEHKLDESEFGGKKIKSISTLPKSSMYSKAKQAIYDADYVIVGPGDLYASILPNFAVRGARKTIQKTKAKIIFIMNLMTRFTQTHNMTAQDHLDAFFNYTHRMPDIVLINDQEIPKKIKYLYQKENEFSVIDDLKENKHYKIIHTPMLKTAMVKKHVADHLPRSFLRHDESKLQNIFHQIMTSQ